MIVIHGGFGYNFRAAFTKVHGSIIYLFSSCQLPETSCVHWLLLLGNIFPATSKTLSPCKTAWEQLLIA